MSVVDEFGAKTPDTKVELGNTGVSTSDMKNIDQGNSQQHIQSQTQAESETQERASIQKSSDPAFWGPGMWKFLHSMAANYPESPPPQFKASSRQFFFSLRHLLPCEKCRGHFNTLLSKRAPDTDSAERLQEWVMWLHNEVNLRIKPHLQPWTMQQIKETYKSDSYVPQVVSQPLHQHTPTVQQVSNDTSTVLPKEVLSGMTSTPRVKQTLRDRVQVTLRKRFSPVNHRRSAVNFFQVSKMASRSRKSIIQQPRKQQQQQQHQHQLQQQKQQLQVQKPQQIKLKLTKPSSGTPVPESAEEKDCGCKK